jgi:hypothetical protein
VPIKRAPGLEQVMEPQQPRDIETGPGARRRFPRTALQCAFNYVHPVAEGKHSSTSK